MEDKPLRYGKFRHAVVVHVDEDLLAGMDERGDKRTRASLQGIIEVAVYTELEDLCEAGRASRKHGRLKALRAEITELVGRRDAFTHTLQGMDERRDFLESLITREGGDGEPTVEEEGGAAEEEGDGTC